MKKIFLLALSIALALSQPAAATRKDDLQIVSQQVLTGTMYRNTLANAYVTLLKDHLRDQSVKIRDPKLLASMIPDKVIEHWRQDLLAVVRDRCITPLGNEDLHKLANLYRQERINDLGPAPKKQTISLEDLEETIKRELPRATEMMKQIAPAINISLCAVSAQMTFMRDMKRNTKALPKTGRDDLIGILQTKGVASFPNRIIKQKILAELQSPHGLE